jgi:hypothetical protein
LYINFGKGKRLIGAKGNSGAGFHGVLLGETRGH